jgi:hypothetical protein
MNKKYIILVIFMLFGASFGAFAHTGAHEEATPTKVVSQGSWWDFFTSSDDVDTLDKNKAFNADVTTDIEKQSDRLKADTNVK